MTKDFEFRTSRGAKIRLTVSVEHITSKTIDADGDKVVVAADEWAYSVDGLSINNNPQSGEFTIYRGQHVIRFGYNGRTPLLIALPGNVTDEIFGAQERSGEAKIDTKIAVDANYQSHYDAVRRAMCDE